MTTTQKITLRFFGQTVLLLILYGIASVVAGTKFLAPEDGLLTVLPYQQAGALANVLLHLTALTGLIGGGLYIGGHQHLNSAMLRLASLLWSVLIVLSVLAGIFGLLGGRNLLELPTLLGVVEVVALVLVLAAAVPNLRRATVQMWALGLGLSLVGILIGLLPVGDYTQDRVLRSVSVGLQLYTGFPLMALALGYWLMHRFSDLTFAWLDHDIYIAEGLALLAGVALTFGSLQNTVEWTRTTGLGSIAVVIAPLLYLLIVVRCYTALTRRNGSRTLSAHWFTLSLVLFFLAFGLLGAVKFAPAIQPYAIGTRLTDLHITLAQLAAVVMGLGLVNQATAELRGQNWRITGLTPFWLVSAGALGGGLALGAAGVVQVYLERLLMVGYLDTQNLLTPLYSGWVLGLLVFLLGVVLYALGFWSGKPEKT
ncbi:MAG: hypothetical protein LCI00_09350 [Chloroflexi bacterium]|nr:hypothetical protein [Chloroflexota bacterium]MCC6893069.1 hypothetical protein [Anaerolineae bacterium]